MVTLSCQRSALLAVSLVRYAESSIDINRRYIKAFDPAVLAAMKTLETTLDDFHKCSATVQQVN